MAKNVEKKKNENCKIGIRGIHSADGESFLFREIKSWYVLSQISPN